jgi:acetyl-CoA acetyltransferase
MSVGSAAALLCSEDLAYKLTDTPVRVYTAGGSHTLRTGDRRPMRIPLLPNETEDDYKDLYADMERHDGRWPGFESFGATRFAAYMAYGMAGITNPIEDFDLVETHDAFTISDLQTYGDIGLTRYGREQDYVTSGDCYHTNPQTGKPGRCPSNLSGGLLGTMHAGRHRHRVVGRGAWQLQNNTTSSTAIPVVERFGAEASDGRAAGRGCQARPRDLACRRRQAVVLGSQRRTAPCLSACD